MWEKGGLCSLRGESIYVKVYCMVGWKGPEQRHKESASKVKCCKKEWRKGAREGKEEEGVKFYIGMESGSEMEGVNRGWTRRKCACTFALTPPVLEVSSTFFCHY